MDLTAEPVRAILTSLSKAKAEERKAYASVSQASGVVSRRLSKSSLFSSFRLLSVPRRPNAPFKLFGNSKDGDDLHAFI